MYYKTHVFYIPSPEARGYKNIPSPEHPFQRTELLQITRQGISWRYTEYKLNTYYC